MKVRVRSQFYDTTAKKVRQQGEIFELTPARFNEIQHKGNFVEPVNEEKPVKA